MKSTRPPWRRLPSEQAGFTLFEALIAVALMGMILTILATVTGQWLPSWKAGFARVQRTDLLGLGLERIVADLAAAEFISLGGADMPPLFEGSSSSATLVRSAIGPNASAGLEIVRLADSPDEGGLVRARAPFTPLAATGTGAGAAAKTGSAPAPGVGAFEFSDAIMVVRYPFQISFSFAGRDRAWKETWSNAATLPTAIRVSVRNAETGQILAVSTATLLHMSAPAKCVPVNSAFGCVDQLEKGDGLQPGRGNRS